MQSYLNLVNMFPLSPVTFALCLQWKQTSGSSPQVPSAEGMSALSICLLKVTLEAGF